LNILRDSEKLEEIGRRRVRNVVDADTAQSRDLLGDMAHVGWLIEFAAERHGCEIRESVSMSIRSRGTRRATSLSSLAFLKVTIPENEM
jgi:hypothetical protein